MNPCRLCGGSAELAASDVKGYQAGEVYKIFVCDNCEASFVAPNETSEEVYDLLYKHAKDLVGYERYFRLAELAKQLRNPLPALAVTEPVYWSVIETIKRDKRHPSEIRILEIGCGLGYLTYAFNMSGYRATGIDISSEAINQATLKFGNYFKVADLFTLSRLEDRYDYVVMMEVIEHVPAPKEFIIAAADLLKKEGKLLVTTPNKSAAPSECNLWQSDMPPVHLWFLSEKSVSTICSSMGYTCEYVNFTDYNKKFFSFSYESTLADLQTSMPRFNKAGHITPQSKVSKFTKWSVMPRFVMSYVRRRIKFKNLSPRSITMCAVISKPS